MRYILSLLIICFFCLPLPAGNPTSVPLGHPVYSFLDRMESLGIIDNLIDGVKPLDRERIAGFLAEISNHREKLTFIDRQYLENYLADFRYELDNSQSYPGLKADQTVYSPFRSFDQLEIDFLRLLQRNQPEEENHIVLWEDGGNSFYFDFIKLFTYDRRSDEVDRNNHTETYRFRGTLAQNFGYLLDVSLVTIRGDQEYRNQDPVLKNTWRKDQEGKTFFDRSGGDLAYRTFVDFRFAQQPVIWGLGESGQLILSDNVEPYAYLSIAKHWSWGSFVFMHGKLLADSTGLTAEGQAIYPDKWIAANRFEFSPLNGLAIGLTDIIIYGNRSADWAYLFPVNFFRSTEHSLRDRDNAMLAIDAEWRLWSGIKFYGTVLVDELKQSELFTDWYGNKHGFQAGLHVVDPFGLPNLALRSEYVAIMPWVYTHKFNVNRYIHDQRSLGHWAGPNSEILYLHVEKDWHHRFKTGIKYTRWIHGENYPDENIGGDIFLGHTTLLGDQLSRRETRKFLEGIRTTENILELYIRYEALNDLFLDLSFRDFSMETMGIQNDLTEIHFGFRFDY